MLNVLSIGKEIYTGPISLCINYLEKEEEGDIGIAVKVYDVRNRSSIMTFLYEKEAIEQEIQARPETMMRLCEIQHDAIELILKEIGDDNFEKVVELLFRNEEYRDRLRRLALYGTLPYVKDSPSEEIRMLFAC